MQYALGAVCKKISKVVDCSATSKYYLIDFKFFIHYFFTEMETELGWGAKEFKCLF